jgi:Flp pilus assembly protein TadB
MPNEFPPDDIRNVWQNQPVENAPMPLEEIQRRARRFEKRIDRRNLREYAGAAIGIAAYTFYFFWFHSLVIRAGSVLVIAGVLYVVVQLYKRASSGSLPADFGVAASIEFQRRELVRQRDMLRSVWRWYVGPIIPGLVVFTVGLLPHRAGALAVGALFLALGSGGIIWFNHRAAIRLDRQIAELDNLER